LRAVYITEHGGVGTLTLGEVPDPVVGPNDVLIKVKACAVNRLDLYTRAGVRGTKLSLDEPHVLGGDASGDVVEVGGEVTHIKTGDRVVVNPRLTCGQCVSCSRGEDELCISPGMLGTTHDGSYAEYVTVPAINAVRLPNSLSYEEASSLPTVFLPCWSILLRKAALKPWETALILSASAGVGTAAIQVAKAVIGATVIATTSSSDKERKAHDLGADEVVDYTRYDLAEQVKELTNGHGVDVVLDHVGAKFWPAAIKSLALGGRYGICGVTTGYKAELHMGQMFLKHQTVFGAFMGRHGDLCEIVELTGRGVIHGVIHETFPLSEASRAHQVMEDRGFFGKLVLTVD